MTKKGLIILIGLLAISLLFFVLNQKQGLSVNTALVEKKEIVRTVLANGHFQAKTKQKLISRDPLVIKTVLVKAGDEIKKGEQLAVFDLTTIEVQKQAALAELAAVSTELLNLETTLPLQKAQIESEWQNTQENLWQAQKEAQAMSELYQLGAVSEMEWRRAESNLATCRAQEQALLIQKAQLESQGALINHHQKQKEALQGQIQVLTEKLNYYQMSAPFSGKVSEVYVQDGDLTGVGTPLFLLSTSDLKVEAEVLAQEAPRLAKGQKVLISGEVLSKQVLTGKIERVSPQAIEKISELGVLQERVPIEISLDEIVEKMSPGYPVDVKIITDQREALAVPREAVFTWEAQEGVFGIKNKRAFFLPLEIGLVGEDYYEVLDGLVEGDLVIINPPKEIEVGSYLIFNKIAQT